MNVRRRLLAALPRERMTRHDVFAGLSGGIAAVPDGMAAGVLAGVSPVQGLYASMAGRIFGGFTASTRMMVVTTTSAAALAAGSAASGIAPADRPAAVLLLTLLGGGVMLLAGVLRLGRYTRFVSHSVMTGFLAGVAANIALGQVPAFTGAASQGALAVQKAWHVLVHPGTVDPRSVVVGAIALILLTVLARTRLRMVAALVALVVPTALVALPSWGEVTVVSDSGEIPTGLPVPRVPDLSLFDPALLGGAFAVAVIVLVQGAGVSESAPNPDGSRPDPDRDFLAQGFANATAAVLRGMPVGGSVGQTALNTGAGARTRWGAIWSGFWLLAILAVFTGLVGRVPMPTLAAVLIVAAVGSVDPVKFAAIWSSGSISRIAVVVTFVATLVLPVTVAVGVGVALSLLMQLNQESIDLRVVRLRVDGDRLVETAAPHTLTDRQIVVLDVYGSLFYAGARTLQAHLPDPSGATAPQVILRLRGRTSVGATFLTVVADYGRRLDRAGGELYLSGVDPAIRALWTDDVLATQGVRVEFFTATATIGESTLAAYAQARVRVHDRARPLSPDSGDHPDTDRS